MLKLFIKTGCPFSAEVRQKLNDERIDYEEYNIADPAFQQKLVHEGGRDQVPFLMDTTRDIGLYRSQDIVAYLEEHYTGDRIAP